MGFSGDRAARDGGGRGDGSGGVVVVHGIDACEPERIARLLASHREQFLKRVFTADEAAYAASGGRREAEHLAARFAAKEAVMKALGTGWAGGVGWSEIGVVRAASGAPALELTGTAARVAAGLGVARWAVSLTHTRSVAMASVLGLSGG